MLFRSALLLHLSPWAGWLGQVLWWPSQLILLGALSVVGMRLGVTLQKGIRLEPEEAGYLGVALAFKLLLLPLLALLLCSVLPLPQLLRSAVVLQAAAPTAVSALLLAEAAKRDADRTAHLVLGGTLIALLTVPSWWWLLNLVQAG